MPTLYWKNADNDGAWNNPNNWFTDAAATNNAGVVPWVADDAYKAYDLSLATGETGEPVINVDIGSGFIITGTCDILGVVCNNTVNGGNWTGDNFELWGFATEGTFSGDGFSNYGTISGGIFSGNGASNGGSIYGGDFNGNGFYLSGTLYDGVINSHYLSVDSNTYHYGGSIIFYDDILTWPCGIYTAPASNFLKIRYFKAPFLLNVGSTNDPYSIMAYGGLSYTEQIHVSGTDILGAGLL